MTKEKKITYEDYQKGRFVGEGVGAPEFQINRQGSMANSSDYLHPHKR